MITHLWMIVSHFLFRNLTGTGFPPVSQLSPDSSPAQKSVEVPSAFSSQHDDPEEFQDNSAHNSNSSSNKDSSTPPSQPELVLRRSTRP